MAANPVAISRVLLQVCDCGYWSVRQHQVPNDVLVSGVWAAVDKWVQDRHDMVQHHQDHQDMGAGPSVETCGGKYELSSSLCAVRVLVTCACCCTCPPAPYALCAEALC
eukprot:150503-Pelagomonas_calceolata.AAC.1